METITVTIMIILFLLALVFIFSTALLTPLIGKKNLLFVILLGFTVGIVGGAFFIAPVFDDIPDMTRSIYELTSNSSEVIGIDVSTKTNVTSFIENTKKIEGVNSVQSSAITIKTDQIPDSWKTTFESRIPALNSNITSFNIPSNDTMLLTVKDGSNPQDAINQIEDWMMLVSGLNINYSIVHVSVSVDSANVNSVESQLPKGDIVITGVNGSIENKVQSVKAAMPNKSDVVILCGFLGMLTGIAGVFIDSIAEAWTRIRKRIKKNE
ncbi:hypothetical protein [Methanobacterium paludis]|uniref:Uncharacterized protein n=1 Tax=Methanobacterium paludis (strain DSM 25820 / JCM 18151 / SWAN1) TaxID=868131 RepID=F6D3S4_METPW|nr:hypothetical protein [Methanobacterium paludis]AEG18068.1 hypothetical protein MSWAN_1047 [Methanobacterium paludis]